MNKRQKENAEKRNIERQKYINILEKIELNRCYCCMSGYPNAEIIGYYGCIKGYNDFDGKCGYYNYRHKKGD